MFSPLWYVFELSRFEMASRDRSRRVMFSQVFTFEQRYNVMRSHHLIAFGMIDRWEPKFHLNASTTIELFRIPGCCTIFTANSTHNCLWGPTPSPTWSVFSSWKVLRHGKSMSLPEPYDVQHLGDRSVSFRRLTEPEEKWLSSLVLSECGTAFVCKTFLYVEIDVGNVCWRFVNGSWSVVCCSFLTLTISSLSHILAFIQVCWCLLMFIDFLPIIYIDIYWLMCILRGGVPTC